MTPWLMTCDTYTVLPIRPFRPISHCECQTRRSLVFILRHESSCLVGIEATAANTTTTNYLSKFTAGRGRFYLSSWNQKNVTFSADLTFNSTVRVCGTHARCHSLYIFRDGTHKQQVLKLDNNDRWINALSINYCVKIMMLRAFPRQREASCGFLWDTWSHCVACMY